MPKELKQIIITVIMVVVLIFVAKSNLKKKPGKKITGADNKPDAAEQSKDSVKGSGKERVRRVPADEKAILSQQEKANATWGRDPFNPTIERDYQLSELKLQGISFGRDKDGFAFINDEIVKKGSIVGVYEVMEVEKNRVLLKKGSQNFYLAFPKD
ncbi:MAG: hypothetical protein ABIG46_01750 [Candidatus Omnitrophota bacterium]|nr:hypothetical protein [Candidatus Omnitrophota bacterium]